VLEPFGTLEAAVDEATMKSDRMTAALRDALALVRNGDVLDIDAGMAHTAAA
jgi:hypothetical protein